MASGMEVDADPPPLIENSGGSLKRCNSAPMINMLSDSVPVNEVNRQKQSQDDSCKPVGSLSTPNLLLVSSSSSFHPFEPGKSRVRHNSTSSIIQSTHHHNHHLATPIKVPNRIHQIKREEEVHRNREISHEREVQSAFQMTQSWDEHFRIEDPAPPLDSGHKARPRSLSESLHIFTSGFPVSSSPSPTRVVKQCFSPSMQAPVIFGNSLSFTPSPSPSPTRRVARRSLSPIVNLKPSSLSQKRKLDPDAESGFSQPKRIFSGSLLSPASLSLTQPNHLTNTFNQNGLTAHARSSNLSTGSFDESHSEPSSAGTVTSGSASVATPFGFTPLTVDSCSNTTDSENEMSEPANMNNSCSNSGNLVGHGHST